MTDSGKNGSAAETKILVVDDDRNAASYIADFLRNAAYGVSVCHSGPEALDFIKSQPVDLVLLDVMMPGMDGFATAAELKKSFGKTIFVPIIFLSALSGQQEKITGLQHADDFVTKPFHTDELLARIRVMLRIRELQRELFVSKSNYEFLYENAPHMYVSINENREVSDCNAMFCRKTGRTKEQALGTSLFLYFGPDDHRVIRAFLDSLASGKIPPQLPAFVFAGGTAAAETVYVNLSAVCLDNRGERSSFMVAMQDVTQNVRLEQEQKNARTQLYRSARLASIGTFASGVAHELNNPLTAILGFSGALVERIKKNETIDKDELEQYLGIIHAETLRCSDTVENLSRFAREGEAQIKEFDLGECVNGAFKLVKAQASRKRIEIVAQIPAAIRVKADMQKLQQAVVYVLTNSVDFCGEGSRVSVSADSGKGFARIYIRDNGPGIPAAILPKVFDPFFTTKQVGQGMGLGLAMSHVIMEECNGAIDVSSEAGKGTTVILEVPGA
jgi:PAS domain S-box-containing protein